MIVSDYIFEILRDMKQIRIIWSKKFENGLIKDYL
jgi:hypothetical protein